MDASRVTQLYFNEMVHLHGISKSITSDIDVRTRLSFNNVYHPQIDR